MKHLDLNSTIGDWISERPSACHVLSDLRLNGSEGRAKPLQQECWERQLAPLDVLARLHVVQEQQNGEAIHD